LECITTPTNDKGVDVTGISQNGITTVKEVIQVKRNITAPFSIAASFAPFAKSDNVIIVPWNASKR